MSAGLIKTWSSRIADSALLFAASGVLIWQGIVSHLDQDPGGPADAFGPGAFVIGVGLAMAVTSLALLVSELRARPGADVVCEEEVPRETWWICALIALHIFLIGVVGYTLSTFLLFVAYLKIAGVKRWMSTVLMAAGLAAAFHVLFVMLARLPFPRSLLFP